MGIVERFDESLVVFGETLQDYFANLDLSYRAQLNGWRIQYTPHVVTPAELPVHIRSLQQQQFRWAKGSVQCALKLLGRDAANLLWPSNILRFRFGAGDPPSFPAQT